MHIDHTSVTETTNTLTDSNHNFGKFVFALLVMLLFIGWSIYYKGPSGQTFSIESFIVFWLRELVISAFGVVVVVIIGINWFKRRSQQHRGKDHAS